MVCDKKTRKFQPFLALYLVVATCILLSGRHVWAKQPSQQDCNSLKDNPSEFRMCVEKKAGFPKIDAATITEVSVLCRPENETGEPLGNPTCQDRMENGKKIPGFISQVEELVNADLSFTNKNFYEGKMLDPDATEPGNPPAFIPVKKPICNLQKNEGTVENNKNQLNDYCGDYCQPILDIGTLSVSIQLNEDPKKCIREKGWYLGAYLQAKNHYKEILFNKLKSHKVDLVDYDGVKPCAQIAREVMRIDLTEKMHRERILKKTTHTENLSNLKCDDNVESSTPPTSTPEHLACHMKHINKLRIAEWSHFLTCEIRSRAQKSHRKELTLFEALTTELSAALKEPCKMAVENCQYGSKNFAPCTNERKNQALNACYQGEVTKFFLNKFNLLWNPKAL